MPPPQKKQKFQRCETQKGGLTILKQLKKYRLVSAKLLVTKLVKGANERSHPALRDCIQNSSRTHTEDRIWQTRGRGNEILRRQENAATGPLGSPKEEHACYETVVTAIRSH